MSDFKGPEKVNIIAGIEYFWCACGKAKNGVFCDGSHRVTNMKPVKFKAEKTGEVFICRCKKTKNAPYCDGSHNKSE